MNAIRTIIAIVWLTGLLPGMVQASDADQFVAASRSQQAELLTQWATAPEAARLPLLQALQSESLYTDSQKHNARGQWFPWVKQKPQQAKPKPCV